MTTIFSRFLPLAEEDEDKEAANIKSMVTVRITEAELTRDVRSVLEKVEQGDY